MSFDMSYNKLIHDYLDTGLAQPQEDALFNALAADQNLRANFGQQLSIMKIAANDMNSISPPIEATNAVFSSLGFTVPSNNAAGVVAEEGRRKPGASLFASASGIGLFSIFKDNLNTLASIGIAAILSTLLFMLFQENLPINTHQDSGITLAQNYHNVPSMGGTPPVVSSFERTERNTQQQMVEKTNTNTNSSFVPIARETATKVADDRNNDNQDIATNSTTDNNVEDKYSNLKINENGYTIVRVQRFDTESEDVNQLQLQPYKFTEPTGFSLELRGANNYSRGTSVNDMQIGVNFEFIDNLYAIGMIGNEHYVVRVANPLSAGESVKYSEEAMVSFMFGLRYAPDELLLDGLLVPYVQANASGISNGFAGGFESGLMMNINQHYSLLVGYGKQFARYNFESKFYNTDKSGVNLGIRYSF
jgi:hypothetical protein